MNVVICNKQAALAGLDIDIIKSISGVYEASEIVEMFKNFFYSRMILDVTALNNYDDIGTYDTLVRGLDPSKIIFYLPEGSSLCTTNFLSHLISLGIYNFTTNLNGVKYLVKKPNSIEDVKHIVNASNVQNSVRDSETAGAAVASIETPTINAGGNSKTVIGFKNVTESAGCTTLIFMIKKELTIAFGQQNVLAIEIDKNDFGLFDDKNMISVKSSDAKEKIKESNARIILVDLNGSTDDSFCGEVIYLIEPSTIKLNRLVRRNREVFSKLNDKKVVLNQSLLLNNDVFDFESEAAIRVFYNMPPLDERKRNAIIGDFLTKLGILSPSSKNGSNNKIFGLFRR